MLQPTAAKTAEQMLTQIVYSALLLHDARSLPSFTLSAADLDVHTTDLSHR